MSPFSISVSAPSGLTIVGRSASTSFMRFTHSRDIIVMT